MCWGGGFNYYSVSILSIEPLSSMVDGLVPICDSLGSKEAALRLFRSAESAKSAHRQGYDPRGGWRYKQSRSCRLPTV